MRFKKVRLDRLNFSSTPVRLKRSEESMERLKSSLKATDGPVDPLIVRDLGSSEYIVVAGESRAKALMEAGYPPDWEVPCLIGEFDDRSAVEYALIENYVRSALTAYEEALVIRLLVTYYGMTNRAIAEKLGKSEQHISHMLSVFELCGEVQEALHEGSIRLSHAQEIYLVRQSKQLQQRLLNEIIRRGLSARATRTRARELLGEGREWLIEPVDVWLSKAAKLAVHPAGTGYRVDFSFSTAEEFETIMKLLRTRMKRQAIE